MWNRKLSALAGVLTCVVVVGVSGCGSERAGDSTSTEQSQSDSSRNDPKSEKPDSGGTLDSPVTFHRTGGVAGFRDKLVVRSDGVVTLEGPRGDPFECTIPQPKLAKIADAVGSVRLEGAAASSTKKLRREAMPDELYTSVTIDGAEYDSSLTDKDESLGKLFKLMHGLLDAAHAARDGGRSTCG